MAINCRSKAIGHTSDRGHGVDYQKAIQYMEQAIYWQKKHLSGYLLSFDSDSRNYKEQDKKYLAEMEEKLKEYKKRLKATR